MYLITMLTLLGFAQAETPKKKSSEKKEQTTGKTATKKGSAKSTSAKGTTAKKKGVVKTSATSPLSHR